MTRPTAPVCAGPTGVGSSGANGTAAINADGAYRYPAVWVPNLGDGTVHWIDPLTNLVVAAIYAVVATTNTAWPVHNYAIPGRRHGAADRSGDPHRLLIGRKAG